MAVTSNLAIRRMPRSFVAFVLTIEVVAAGVTGVLAVRLPATGRDLTYFGVIVGLGVLANEAARGVERMRRWFSTTPHVNMSSVWTLSAALLTTPVLSAVTTVLLYTHLWFRSWRHVSDAQAFRVVFNVSVVVLSCYSAAGVFHWLAPGLSLVEIQTLVAVGSAILVYSVVNSGLAAAALWAFGHNRSLAGLIGTWSENSLEYATLCIGALTAAILLWNPWLVVLVLLPVYVLHRSVLIRQLEHKAITDQETGLLNAATWHSMAEREFERAGRDQHALAVMMIDVDAGARTSGGPGGLVGGNNPILRRVADVIRAHVGDGDLGGRFGDDEMVLLLPRKELADAVALGHSIIGEARNSGGLENAACSAACHEAASDETGRPEVSIGVAASCPGAGTRLADVLLTADNALFAAKDAGGGELRATQCNAAGPRRSSSGHVPTWPPSHARRQQSSSGQLSS